MEQVLYSLPEGWHLETIGEVVSKLVTGKTPSTKKAEYYSSSEVDWFTPSDFGSTAVLNNSRRKLSSLAIEDGTIKQMPKGSILLVAIGATIGKVGLAEDETCFNQQVTGMYFKEQIHPKYAYYWLSYIKPEIIAKSSQATLPIINQTGIKGLSFLYPEKEEQKRIVEKLDALLTRIDTAIKHLQSKLDLSKQLFNSVLDEFFKLSDCDSVPLTDVVNFIGGSQPPKSQFSDDQKEGYVRLIQIRDYKSGNHIVYVDSASTKKFCTKDDVMIGRYGPPVFQILRGLDGAYNVALMKAVPNEDVLTKDYLFWFLQSPSIQNYVIGISQRAAGQSGVNKKALEKYLIPVPNKAIQDDIVDKVGQLASKSRVLEAEVTAEIATLSQLKASILDSAFKGEL